MSGALKHFFDGIYYPCLEATRRRPYGLYVHGASDTGGAVRAVETITTGLQWQPVRPPVCITGTPGKQDLEACWELGALLAAEVAGTLSEGLEREAGRSWHEAFRPGTRLPTSPSRRKPASRYD